LGSSLMKTGKHSQRDHGRMDFGSHIRFRISKFPSARTLRSF